MISSKSTLDFKECSCIYASRKRNKQHFQHILCKVTILVFDTRSYNDTYVYELSLFWSYRVDTGKLTDE